MSVSHPHSQLCQPLPISSLKIGVLPDNPTISKCHCRKRSFTLRQQAQNIWCNFLGLRDLPGDWSKKPPKINKQVVCEEHSFHSLDLSLRHDGLWYKINYEVAFFQEYHSTKRMGRWVCGIPGIWGKALSKELPRKKKGPVPCACACIAFRPLLPSYFIFCVSPDSSVYQAVSTPIYHNHVIYRLEQWKALHEGPAWPVHTTAQAYLTTLPI